MQFELDLAGGIRQPPEMPGALHLAERAVFQADGHFLGNALGVFRPEMLFHVQVADVDGRLGDAFIAAMQFGAAAPGQELWIVLHPVHQLEHLQRRVGHENRFNDFGHQWKQRA